MSKEDIFGNYKKKMGSKMGKEGLENLTLIGYDEGKRSREKVQVTYLMILYEWKVQQEETMMVNS